MKRIFMLFAAALLALAAAAQEASFPTIDAGTLGMGGITMTAVSDAHTVYNNAAFSIFAPAPLKLSTSYYGQSDFDYYATSGYWRWNPSNSLQLGWRQYRRERGNHDSALDIGYARRIGERWAVGLTGRYMHLKRPDESADALAVDLSAAWWKPVEGLGSYSTLRAGAKLSNLGGFLGGSNYRLPMDIKAGAALDTFFSDAHELTVAAEAGYCFDPGAVRGFQAAIGAEYNLMQLLQFRAGYHVGERKAYYPSFGSLGIGVRILHLRVDFAYLLAARDTFLRNTYSISFGLDF